MIFPSQTPGNNMPWWFIYSQQPEAMVYQFEQISLSSLVLTEESVGRLLNFNQYIINNFIVFN